MNKKIAASESALLCHIKRSMSVKTFEKLHNTLCITDKKLTRLLNGTDADFTPIQIKQLAVLTKSSENTIINLITNCAEK